MLHSDALQSVSLGMPAGSLGPDDPESINFEAIVRFLRKRYRLCLAWLLAGVLLGGVYAVLSPPSYTAISAVLLEDPGAKSMRDAVAQSDSAHTTYVETQIQVFSSDEVIGRVVDSLNLVDDPEFGRTAGGVRKWLVDRVRPYLRSPEPLQREPRYATITRVRHALSVSRVGVSDVLQIQFTSRDPARSAEFAEAVVRSYVESRLAIQRAIQAETTAHIRKLLDELRAKAFPAIPPAEAAASGNESNAEARARFLEEQQKTDTYRTLYASLLQRLMGETGLQAQASNIQVITPPAPPLIAGSRFVIIAAFVIVGGLVGFGHALLREATDDTLRSPHDVSRCGQVGRVILVPTIRRRQLHLDASRDPAQRQYTAQCTPIYDVMGKAAVVLLEGNSRPGPRLIAVVSPTGGTGTSLAAGQLAHVFADTGRRTCLIDANWRQKLIHPSARAHDGDEKFARWTETLGDAGVNWDLITLRSKRAVSDLVASRFVMSILEEQSQFYDCIVVDLHSSACSMDLEAAVGLFDQIIIVVEAGRTPGKALRDTLQLVPKSKRRTLILNKAQGNAKSFNAQAGALGACTRFGE